MGIDGMRVGGGRCPPLIVAGLMVACFLLVCNWWSLSAENTELLRQIDGLSQQLKISAEQRDECAALHGKAEQHYKTAEEEISKLHRQLGLERDAAKRKDNAVTDCEVELDSLKNLDFTKTATVKSLRLREETINAQLEEKKKENKKLQEDLENLQDELSRLKLSQDATENKKSSIADSPVLPKAVKPSAPQLGPVPEGAVEVSPSGHQGIRYYGIPVLPRDPPGAVRQQPRFSVTMLKAAGETPLTNDTQNGGNQEIQNVEDARANHPQSEETEGEVVDNTDAEDAAQEDIREQMLQTQVTEADAKPNN